MGHKPQPYQFFWDRTISPWTRVNVASLWACTRFHVSAPARLVGVGYARWGTNFEQQPVAVTDDGSNILRLQLGFTGVAGADVFGTWNNVYVHPFLVLTPGTVYRVWCNFTEALPQQVGYWTAGAVTRNGITGELHNGTTSLNGGTQSLRPDKTPITWLGRGYPIEPIVLFT
jgi:hypothetical protein